MPNLILTISNNGTIVNNSITLNSNSLNRLSVAFRNLYFPTEGILVSPAIPATDDGQGNTTPYIPAVYREPNQREVAKKISEVVFSTLKNQVISYEKNIVIKTTETITEIPTTDIDQT